MMTAIEILPDTSRVWIYQSSRPFTATEAANIEVEVQRFAAQWVSHSRQLQAFGALYHQQFVVLMVDESQAGASGCSIDSSVNFIRFLEGKYGVDFFDRMTFAYQIGEEVKTASKADFKSLYAEGVVNEETLVFDNLVKTKGDFTRSWKKPLAQSWHKRFV